MDEARRRSDSHILQMDYCCFKPFKKSLTSLELVEKTAQFKFPNHGWSLVIVGHTLHCDEATLDYCCCLD